MEFYYRQETFYEKADTKMFLIFMTKKLFRSPGCAEMINALTGGYMGQRGSRPAWSDLWHFCSSARSIHHEIWFTDVIVSANNENSCDRRWGY